MRSTPALYEQVYDSLLGRIYGGRYPRGASLPANPALAEEYGVSTITIRNAVAMLQRAKLIEISANARAMVVFDSGEPAQREAYFLWLAERQDAVMELYRILSVALPYWCACALPHLTQEIPFRLRGILHQTNWTGGSYRERIDQCNRFFRIYLGALANPTLISLYDRMVDFLFALLTLSGEIMSGTPQTGVSMEADIREILALIELGDSNALYAYLRRRAALMKDMLLRLVNTRLGEVRAARQVRFRYALRPENNFLYALVANDIIVSACCGRYRAGDFLPSEAQLCAQYDTSIITVRRALAYLNRIDIAETINGRGTLVTGADPSRNPEHHRAVLGDAGFFSQIMQVLALSLPMLAHTAFVQAGEANTRAFGERLAEAANRGEGHLALIFDFVVQYTCCPSAHDILRQMQAELCLCGRFRPYYEKTVPDFGAEIAEALRRSVKAMRAFDEEGFLASVYDQLRLTCQLLSQLECGEDVRGMPFPELLRLREEITSCVCECDGELDWENKEGECQ